MVEEFTKRYIERMSKSTKISESRKSIEIERMSKWGESIFVLEEDEEERWEFEGMNLEEFICEGKNSSKGEVDEEVEERIRGWQEYYRDKEAVFDSDDIRGEYGRTELMLGIVSGLPIEEIRELLDDTEDYGLVDNFGYDIIQLACLEYRDDILEELKVRGIYREE